MFHQKLKPALLVLLPLAALLLALRPAPPPAWGFYGHRKINHQAVFTLPPEMLVFFKKNIDWLTEHAVDADNRRYASPHEAPRHFLDLDRYGSPPFDNLPRNWTDALMQYARYFFVNERGDTLRLVTEPVTEDTAVGVTFHPKLFNGQPVACGRRDFRRFFTQNILPQYYGDEPVWAINCDSLSRLLGGADLNCGSAFVTDTFSQHGVLPYNLEQMLRRLTDAFREQDAKRILRYAADIGHYIADAHVPLHTTMNYNGQLTGQEGLHAFWETRLPEMFAEENYDFWVGPAGLMEDPQSYFWGIVLKSHSLVDSVTDIERALRREFPTDRQMCSELRGDVLVKTQCANFARAYHERMGGMVEGRMQGAILAVGSAWYTAWVLAGQPDLTHLGEAPMVPDSTDLQIQQAKSSGTQLGRPHE
ncbi:MAG: hypothetical protein HY842_09335 [Bacteroidetes bacterium]|nr:hypothetical protein [Bacteroidota bacterium]